VPSIAGAQSTQTGAFQTIALTTTICVAWMLPGLVGHDPWKPDEAHTFGVVYEILTGGSWLVPHLAGEVFLHDPPLFHLLAALTATIFSPWLPLHDGARLASGLCMAIAFAFCGLAGRELNGSPRGALAVLLLLGSFGLVVRSHQLITDTSALAGFAMAYYGCAVATRRAAGGFWIGTGAGLVFMTQGVIEAAVIALIAATLALLAPWRQRTYAAALSVAVAAVLPWLAIWPGLLYLQSPLLLEQWLWHHDLGGMSARGAAAGLLYYLRILPWYAWPVWPVALWTLWRARASGLGRAEILLPLVGFAITLALISAAREARELYALPLLIPLTLLATVSVESLRRGAANAWYWFSLTGFTFFVLVAWFYWSGLELGVPVRLHEHLHRIRPGYEPGFRWLPFLLGIAYSLLWLAVLVSFRRSPIRPVAVWATGVTVMWALMATLFLGWADNAKTYRGMIASMQRALPEKYDCIASHDLGEPQRAMLHYFAGIVTHRDEVPPRRRECELLLVQGHPRSELAPRGAWRKIWEGGRPGDKDERYRLYRRK
jgi:4-amino-4-deoxy-L-arabinose transferase-like glycosyltransferase